MPPRSDTMTTIALVAGSAVLCACGAAASAETPSQGPSAGADDLAPGQAREYLGDPWEHRYRDQLLASQHLHDSWNPCHLGENVPKSMLGHGLHCYSRLVPHTGRQGLPAS